MDVTYINLLLYIISSVLFIISSVTCFRLKKSIPKIAALFLLSPTVGNTISFLTSAYLDSLLGWNAFYDAGFKESVLFAVLSTGVQLLIQAISMALYVRLVKAQNSSIAIFVYLCSVMIIPPALFIVLETTLFSMLFYLVLNIMFFFLVIRPLAVVSGEHQVTDRKLFLILPTVTFAFSTFIYTVKMCIWSVTELDDEKINAIKLITQSEGDELLDRLKPIVSMAIKVAMYEQEILMFCNIFITFVLIIAFYVIVRNIDFMNKAIKAQAEIKELSVEVMEALAHTIDAKDEYTRGHSIRVAQYSRMIAGKMGMTNEECENVYYMGLLHDIGKIGVPNEIINKPSHLTDEEYSEIKKHPATGYEILAEIKTRPELSTGARWHHERFDGTGYPDHKKGDEIPIEARIIAVADSYDAMTSNRSYRRYLPQQKVREEIEKNIGTQFDEKPARCMIEIMDEDKDYVLHE